MARPLNAREVEILRWLDDTEFQTPRGVGGRDGSHHSNTLSALAKRGLVERKKIHAIQCPHGTTQRSTWNADLHQWIETTAEPYAGCRCKGHCRYRRTPEGKAAILDQTEAEPAAHVKLTHDLYCLVRHALVDLGHLEDYTWSQNLKPPATAESMCCEYVWVVLNSGMRNTVAQAIMGRVWPQLLDGKPVSDVFGHKGKAIAIERVWGHRADYFTCFNAILGSVTRTSSGKAWSDTAVGDAVVAWCKSLPWIGDITKYHLAKNLGADVAKPDRWLVRLADAEGTTVEALCRGLAEASGDRVATVDVILWRACSIGLLRVEDGAISLASGVAKY